MGHSYAVGRPGWLQPEFEAMGWGHRSVNGWASGVRVRVKICGLTSPADATAAAQVGADAIGLVFHSPSVRHVGIEQAREICMAVPPFVSLVGLFVDAPPARVETVLERVPLDLLQFHGAETPEFCRRFGRPYIKALRVKPGAEVAAVARRYPDAKGVLLDAWHPRLSGGAGASFDWALVPEGLGVTLILAGGLSAGNVGRAIERVRPYAVDVSSSVESRPGVKDRARMAAFIEEVRRVEANQ